MNFLEHGDSSLDRQLVSGLGLLLACGRTGYDLFAPHGNRGPCSVRVDVELISSIATPLASSKTQPCFIAALLWQRST